MIKERKVLMGKTTGKDRKDRKEIKDADRIIALALLKHLYNNGDIASAMEPQSHQRSKHILRRYRMIKVIISAKRCESIKSATDDNVADHLIRCSPRENSSII